MPQRRSFDPEGNTYDEATARLLRRRNPLPKASVPSRWQRTPPFTQQPDEIRVGNAFEAWVWHPEAQRYLPHGGSVTQDIDLLGEDRLGEGLASQVREQFGDDVSVMLKGRRHPTWGLGVEGEENLSPEQGGPREVVPGPGGRYFSIRRRGPQ